MSTTTPQSDTGQGGNHLLDAAIAFAIRVASAGLVFALQVFLARLMPLGDYGSYITGWTWIVMLGAFVPLGLAESAVRFLPRYRARGRHGSALAFWRFGLLMVVAASAAVAVACTGAVYFGFTGTQQMTLIALMIAGALPFIAIQNFLEGVSRAHGWYRLTSVPIYIVRPLLIMALCAALAWAGVSMDLSTVAAAVVAAVVLVTAGIYIMVRRAIARQPQPQTEQSITGSRKVWFRASLPLMLACGMEDLLIYTDVLVLGMLLDPAEVGIYFAAARALALANFVYYAFYFVSARRFSIANALSNRTELQNTVWATTRATFWFTALAVAATLLVGPWLLAAFGESFQAGYSVMWILAAGLMLRAVSGQASELLVTTGRQKEVLVASMTAVVFNAGMSFLLVPVYGIEGAAWATMIAMAARSTMFCIAVRRTLNISVVALGLPSLRLSAAN